MSPCSERRRLSKRACSSARRSLHSALAETPKGGRLIVEHFKNVLKAQNFERVFDLGREAANLDVAAAVAHLFDEAHKNAQAGRRDVVELFAVDRSEEHT